MCGSGNGIYKDNKLDIYLGFYGASLELNNKTYEPSNYTENIKNGFEGHLSRVEMFDYINESLSKDELIEIILQVIDNGSEE